MPATFCLSSPCSPTLVWGHLMILPYVEPDPTPRMLIGVSLQANRSPHLPTSRNVLVWRLLKAESLLPPPSQDPPSLFLLPLPEQVPPPTPQRSPEALPCTCPQGVGRGWAVVPSVHDLQGWSPVLPISHSCPADPSPQVSQQRLSSEATSSQAWHPGHSLQVLVVLYTAPAPLETPSLHTQADGSHSPHWTVGPWRTGALSALFAASSQHPWDTQLALNKYRLHETMMCTSLFFLLEASNDPLSLPRELMAGALGTVEVTLEEPLPGKHSLHPREDRKQQQLPMQMADHGPACSPSGPRCRAMS